MTQFLHLLVCLVCAGFILFIAGSIYADRQLKKEMSKTQQKAENDKWVNQLIENIKDESDELVN
jgi:hypothetical protein